MRLSALWLAAVVVASTVASPRAAAAQPVRDASSGHYYAVFRGLDLTWDEAALAASAQTFMGAVGHLATVTSASENLFLSTVFGTLGGGPDDIEGVWLGGLQPVGSIEPDQGWVWMTGEAFVYNNWPPPYTPNNAGGTEDRITFGGDYNADGKTWNDFTGVFQQTGYVVEFDVSTVPEPATVCLVGVGLLGVVGGVGRTRRRSTRT